MKKMPAPKCSDKQILTLIQSETKAHGRSQLLRGSREKTTSSGMTEKFQAGVSLTNGRKLEHDEHRGYDFIGRSDSFDHVHSDVEQNKERQQADDAEHHVANVGELRVCWQVTHTRPQNRRQLRA